jgi:Fe2+ transport system protein FeoA
MRNMTLPMLDAGETATIAGITGKCLPAKRLADMGFVRGARLEMIRPGLPCIVRVGGVCVGLGAAYQDSIQLA